MVKTIRISDEFHAKLEAKGNKNESFEDIIKRLIDDRSK